MASDDLKHKTADQLKDMLGAALDEAKMVLDGADDHGDEAAAEAIGRAIDIWRELQGRAP
jgi:predicted oxidoreductase